MLKNIYINGVELLDLLLQRLLIVMTLMLNLHHQVIFFVWDALLIFCF